MGLFAGVRWHCVISLFFSLSLCGVAFPWLIFSENVRRLRFGWVLLVLWVPLELNSIVGLATRDGMRCTRGWDFLPGHVGGLISAGKKRMLNIDSGIEI